ncbi:MAG: peroxiredoxin family protein [Cyanobacteria bacterium]|nr:peroxiredoxin family protein [Cyanobacteriota bacterium]
MTDEQESSIADPSEDSSTLNAASLSAPVRVVIVLAASALTAVMLWFLFITPKAHGEVHAGSPQNLKMPSLVTLSEAYTFLTPVPVGQKAPVFSERDGNGKAVHLNDFRGKKNVVLIFYQGSFCHVCGKQLESFQTLLDSFSKHNTEVIGISADDDLHTQETIGEHGITFSLIPDPQKALIKLYGVPNMAKNGLAWPSLFIVDKRGVITTSYATKDSHRLSGAETLSLIQKLK